MGLSKSSDPGSSPGGPAGAHRKQTALLSSGRERLFVTESARSKSTRDGSRKSWWTRIMSCVFCENKEIKKREILRTDLVRVFPTKMPIVPGHLLIVPTRPVATFEELAKEEILEIQKMASRLSNVLKKIYEVEGFNYAWNEGKVAGQSVPHFHLHIVPRKEGDTGIYEYEPRKFLYRPGSHKESPEAELIAIAKEIKKLL